MKKYTQYIPVTALAAAIMLAGSLSAQRTASEGTGMRDQQGQRQMSEKTDTRPMTASDVLGMNINNAANEKVGEIDEIFIDSDSGEVLAIVVSTGGFLGMGKQQTIISPEDLRLNADRTLMQTDISKDQIEKAPLYEKGDLASLDQVRPLGKTAAARTNRTYQSDRTDRTDRTNLMDQTNRTNRPDQMDRTDRTNRSAQTDRSSRHEGVQQKSRELAVSDLVGMSVENHQGESVGKINEVYLDLEKSEVVGVVVSTGGFLGLGDRKTLFGLRELSFDSSNETVLLDYSRDQIRGFPEYDVNDHSVFTALRERTDHLTSRSSDYRTGDTARSEARTGARNVGRSDRTVFDQGNSSEEIAMTASIRTAIRENNTLSSRASNVTIITKDGKVVLRGEVDSAAEKTTVEGIARNKAGRQNVTSELTVRGGEQVSQ